MTRHLTLLVHRIFPIFLFIGLAWGQTSDIDILEHTKKLREKIKSERKSQTRNSKTKYSSYREKQRVKSESSPCNDEKYIFLKKKPMDEMSDREWDYFMLMHERCLSYNEKSIQPKKKKESLVDKRLCRYCEEWINKKATVCIHCKRDKSGNTGKLSTNKTDTDNSLLYDIGSEILNIFEQGQGSSNIYSDRRCEYDGERLLEYNSTTKLTSDGKFMKGLKCGKCGRTRFFEK